MTTKNSGRKIALRIIAPVLIAGAFAGLAGATSAAAAPAQQSTPGLASASAHLTQGFDIRNLSSHTVKLVGIESPGRGDGAPYVGTVLRPGEALRYEKVFWFGNTPKTKLSFNETDGAGNVSVFQIELWVDSFLNVPSVMIPYSDGNLGGIEVQGLGYGSRGISFVDKFGSAPIQVRAEDKQRQADLLNRLCVDGQAACTFRPTSNETGPVLVQRKVSEVNRLDAAYPMTVSDSFTFNATTNVEVSASGNASLFGLVNTTLSAKYGASWSQGKTATISRTFPVQPGYRAFLEVHQPTVRQHGDFTVTMGNTTWNLTDVYFDIPDMSKQPDVVVDDEKA